MYIPDLDMDLVRCFVAVAENGGFTAAGKRLNLSQSAVSLKIQRLENLLDRRVFSRTSRSLELTAEGEILLNYAGRLLALNKEILERIGEPAIEAIVRVGVVEYFGQQFLPGLLAQFKQGRPNVRLSVEVGMSQDLVNALAEGKFDFVIATAGKIPSSEVKMENVTQERILLTEPRLGSSHHLPNQPSNRSGAPCLDRFSMLLSADRARGAGEARSSLADRIHKFQFGFDPSCCACGTGHHDLWSIFCFGRHENCRLRAGITQAAENKHCHLQPSIGCRAFSKAPRRVHHQSG